MPITFYDAEAGYRRSIVRYSGTDTYDTALVVIKRPLAGPSFLGFDRQSDPLIAELDGNLERDSRLEGRNVGEDEE